MTISSNLNKHIYVGNGTTKTFDYTFYTLTEDDLHIYLTDTTTGIETEITANYSISPSEGYFPSSSGTVTYPSIGDAIESTHKLTLLRNLDVLQPTVYPNNTSLKPKVVEKSFDRITMIAQQQQEELDRSMQFSITVPDTFSRVLPAPVALKALRINSAGTAFEYTTDPETAYLSAEAAKVAAQTSQAAAEVAEAAAEALALQDYTGVMKVSDIITKGPWVDVRVFGAVGDGVTDDTTAIQSAFNFSKHITIPAGTFLISSTINVQADTIIRGVNEFESKIIFTGIGTAFNCMGGYNAFSGFFLCTNPVDPLLFKIGTKAFYSATVGCGVTANNIRIQGFENCFVATGYYWKFFNCTFYYNKIAFNGVSSNNLSFFGCGFSGGQDFVRSTGGSGPISFYGCSFESWSGVVVGDVSGGILQVNMDGSYIENSPATNNTGTGFTQFNGSFIFGGQFSVINFNGNTVQCVGIRRVLYSTIAGTFNSIGNFFWYESGTNLSSTEHFYSIVGGSTIFAQDKAIPYDTNYGYGTYTTVSGAVNFTSDIKVSGYDPLNLKCLTIPWTDITLQNGWANTGTADFPILSCKVDKGVLYIRGQVTGVTATSGIIATLPVSIVNQLSTSSAYVLGLMIASDDSMRSFRMLSDGKLLIGGTYNTYFNFPNVAFPVNA